MSSIGKDIKNIRYSIEDIHLDFIDCNFTIGNLHEDMID